jgi:hypothetical protein
MPITNAAHYQFCYNDLAYDNRRIDGVDDVHHDVEDTY